MVTLSAIIVWIFFGILAGLIARMLVPGPQPMGWLATMTLGIIGSFAGGFLTYVFRGGEPLQPTGMLMSVLGAIIVLLLAGSMGRTRQI
ncbi:MAG TPA: GlsB/YeaQ/YmgE family stress response membrane protein [Planctomicrobium sp.]|nr:GlsB/YeaQ/YmgE family stress response membrane protein [Planctomicrobium sp.]